METATRVEFARQQNLKRFPALIASLSNMPNYQTAKPKTSILQIYPPHRDIHRSPYSRSQFLIDIILIMITILVNLLINMLTRACWMGWRTTLALVPWSLSSSRQQMSSLTSSSLSGPAAEQGWIWFKKTKNILNQILQIFAFIQMLVASLADSLNARIGCAGLPHRWQNR